MKTSLGKSDNYLKALEEIKQKVQSAQVKAHLAVNREMLIVYWQIGKIIIQKQKEKKWGAQVTKKLSTDLKIAFPNIKGFSYTNLRYMQTFAKTYPDLLICQQPGGKLPKKAKAICQQSVGKLESGNFYQSEESKIILNIPWGHNVILIDKIPKPQERLWYANQTIENSWSRNVLTHQIASNLYQRQVKSEKINNFEITLPKLQSDLVNNLIKDEYNFEFISNTNLNERELENKLTDNIIKFLLELGKGFAFVGRQYHLNVGGDDFYIDLLFYNIKLKSYFIIELKTGKFKPEYIGKVAFYLSVIDNQIKDQNDQDSIGMILCTQKNQLVAKESVKYITKPVGISEYKMADRIKDKKIKDILPTGKEIKELLGNN